MSAITNILVACDLEERSAGPIRYADALAAQTGARLVAVHVTSSRDVDVTEPGHAVEQHQGERMHVESLGALKQQLRSLLGDDRAAACTLDIRFGHPPIEVLAAAQDHECDVIIVTVENRSRLGKLILGSHSQEILLTADLPVIGVKPDWEPGSRPRSLGSAG